MNHNGKARMNGFKQEKDLVSEIVRNLQTQNLEVHDDSDNG